MKANEAPEKIYLSMHPVTGVLHVRLLKSDDTIEYTRTVALIEKLVNFLNYKLDDVVQIRVPGTVIPHHVVKQELIEDFRNYMKG